MLGLDYCCFEAQGVPAGNCVLCSAVQCSAVQYIGHFSMNYGAVGRLLHFIVQIIVKCGAVYYIKDPITYNCAVQVSALYCMYKYKVLYCLVQWSKLCR